MADTGGRSKRKRSPMSSNASPSDSPTIKAKRQRPAPAPARYDPVRSAHLNALESPPLSPPTFLSQSVLDQLVRSEPLAQRPSHREQWLVARANKEYANGEREVMRAELEMLKAEERRLMEEKEELLDELLRRELGEKADALIREPTLPTNESALPWSTEDMDRDYSV